jgi:hypothetical protein
MMKRAHNWEVHDEAACQLSNNEIGENVGKMRILLCNLVRMHSDMSKHVNDLLISAEP